VTKTYTTTTEHGIPHSSYFRSEGLVSEANKVASSTKELCDAVNGNNHDRVTVAAKNVASATSHLLTAAMIKADASSPSQKRLQAAGKAVTNATTALIKVSAESTDVDVEWIDNASQSAIGSKVQEIEAQMSILKMEKELDRARNKLAGVRKGKYRKEERGGMGAGKIDGNKSGGAGM